MDKKYKPQEVEAKIYSLWEKGGYFTPKIDPKKKPFTIILPLPNANDPLHIGHALFTVEDILVRYHRMLGEPTLWLPGADHAGIETQYVFEKCLAEKDKSRFDFDRETLYQKIYNFVEKNRATNRDQLKKLGFSLDWTRYHYSLEPEIVKFVLNTFRKLHQDGLIYREERLVNYCSHCGTAYSELEVVYQERKDPLYYLKYGPFTLATVRPETKFGDTAVAVHPKDRRYQKWIGKEFTYQSLAGPRRMKVIADEAVDPNFGTGVVKVTPGHDQTDFEIGQRHKLAIIKAIDEEGKMTQVAGKFAGLPVLEARKKVVNELKKRGDLVKVENITHAVGHCQRCGTVTEPMISKQWFVKIKPLAEKAIQTVKSGQIKIIPKRFEKIYFHWLENIRDWCISRQLWWGHKIPLKGETDILDTWFSSGLWPISVHSWPKKTKDFNYFYLNRLVGVRETGYDILFFWVAREIMMCLEMTGKTPFDLIYLHGLVRDEKGQKFSKTKGIGFDPLEIIEKHGADALRMALVVGNSPGRDLKIGEEKVIAYRNLANKLWNAARFVLTYPNGSPSKAGAFGRTGESKIVRMSPNNRSKNPDDRWILEETKKTVKKVTSLLNRYRFDLAAETLYHFFWHAFCDKYIEMSKKRREEAQPTLLHVLETSLKLLHPFMPFVTEEIWGKFPRKYNQPLIISKWPK